MVDAGGTPGIGLATARAALRAGARLTIGARGAAWLSETAAEHFADVAPGVVHWNENGSETEPVRMLLAYGIRHTAYRRSSS